MPDILDRLIANIFVNSADRYQISISSGQRFIDKLFTIKQISISEEQKSSPVYPKGGQLPLYMMNEEFFYSGSIEIQDGEYRAIIAAMKILYTNLQLDSFILFPPNTNIVVINLLNGSVEKITGIKFTKVQKSIKSTDYEVLKTCDFIATGYQLLP